MANTKEAREARVSKRTALPRNSMAACEACSDNNNEAEDVFEPSQEKETSLNELKALLENVQHMLLEMRTETNKWRLKSQS